MANLKRVNSVPHCLTEWLMPAKMGGGNINLYVINNKDTIGEKEGG